MMQIGPVNLGHYSDFDTNIWLVDMGPHVLGCSLLQHGICV